MEDCSDLMKTVKRAMNKNIHKSRQNIFCCMIDFPDGWIKEL